jgi:hypothetical protein
MRLTTNIAVAVSAVRITAADFNGQSFDGSPFVFDGDKEPEWLFEAIRNNQIVIDRSGARDYARFTVKGDDDNDVVVGPGDYIVHHNGKLFGLRGEFVKVAMREIPTKNAGSAE